MKAIGHIRKSRPGRALQIVLAVGVFLGLSAGLWGQFYISQEGRMLDANNRIGSFGLNASVPTYTIGPRVNSMMTGNVTGGASFQGLVPYVSPYEFQAGTGSGALSNFRRDSIGVADLGPGTIAPRVYIDPSRGVTQAFGGRVVSGAALAAEAGARAVSHGPGYDPRAAAGAFAARPLSRGHTRLGEVGGLAGADFAPMPPPDGMTPPGMPWLPEAQPYREPQEGRQMRRTPLDGDSQVEERWGEIETRRPLTPAWDEDEDIAPTDGLLAPPSAFEEAFSALQAQQAAEAEAHARLEGGAQRREADAEGQAELPTTLPMTESLARRRQAQQRGASFLRQGVEFLQRGEYYRAVAAFENAAVMQAAPEIVDLGRGGALFGAGEYMSAAFYINRALERAPALAATRIDIKELFGGEEVIHTALSELNAWHERTEQPMLAFLHGYILLQLGDVAGSRASLELARQGAGDAAAISYLLAATEIMEAAGPQRLDELTSTPESVNR